MRNLLLPAALLATTLATACAQHPDSIVAASVSSAQFADYSCQDVGTDLARKTAELNSLVTMQAREAREDSNGAAWGVLIPIVGIALAAGGPDYSGQIAQLRGEVSTLQTMQTSCA